MYLSLALAMCPTRHIFTFSDIDPVLYSEVMRDIDMVVSIAFVGGEILKPDKARKNSVLPSCAAQQS